MGVVRTGAEATSNRAKVSNVFEIPVTTEGDNTTVRVELSGFEHKQASLMWSLRTIEPLDLSASLPVQKLAAFLSGAISGVRQASDQAQKNQCLQIVREVHDQLVLTLKSAPSSDAENKKVVELVVMSEQLLQSYEAADVKVDSALLSEAAIGNARLLAVFGGQALPWLEELSEVSERSKSARFLIDACVNAVEEELASESASFVSCFYEQGFAIKKWMSEPESAPAASYLFSAPISYPMIFVTQLAQYVSLLDDAGLTPSEAVSLMRSGATGHSQGIVAAVVVATSPASISEFIEIAAAFTRLQFWQGARVQQVAPIRTLPISLTVEGMGEPTPMLSIANAPVELISKHIRALNAALPVKRHVAISLFNGDNIVVVSGCARTLHALYQAMLLLKADPAQNQHRIPFSQRKLPLSFRYLRVSAPFHSPFVKSAIALILEDAKRLHISLASSDLAIPVFSTVDGKNLQTCEDIISELVTMQCSEQVNWPKTLRAVGADTTHLLDFGPGKTAGIGRLSQKIVEGTGIQSIHVGVEDTVDHRYPCRDVLLSESGPVPSTSNWERDFAPCLDQDAKLSTRFTRLYGCPPVMVPGMTPCTAGSDFVAAVTNAGYHVELAGGGQHFEAMFRKSVHDIVEQTPPGAGVTANLLFLNPYLWRFQFPLCIAMRREGYPIESITIAAGIPSGDAADDIVRQCLEVGIRSISLKPGTSAAIRLVLLIASRHPKMQFVVQWTGGQSGGHHSFEDQHMPLLQTYGEMRRHANVIIVVGGGIGDASSASPYLSGAWSRQFDAPSMPVDAVLCGTRVMISRECPTAPAVKKLIAQTPGVANASDWEKSFDGEAGGVITILSELGEPIHKISNRGTQLWRFLEAEYFSIQDDKKRAAKIAEHRDDIIAGINADFQKPFFCLRMSDRTTLSSLSEMTYSDCVARLLDLMAPGGEWIDISFTLRVVDFVERIAECFVFETAITRAELVSIQTIVREDPLALMAKLSSTWPGLSERLLSADDEDYFISLCMRPGKPVNFIPVIDQNLKIWLKKDSLWYSEDLRSVPDQDADRVAILQGPVATRFSSVVDEPVGSILDNIVSGVTNELAPSLLPAASAELTPLPAGVDISTDYDDCDLSLTFGSEDPIDMTSLAPSLPSALQTLLTAPHVVRNKKRWVSNSLQQLLQPLQDRRWAFNGVDLRELHSRRLSYCDAEGFCLCIYVGGEDDHTLEIAVEGARDDVSMRRVTLRLRHTGPAGDAELALNFDVDIVRNQIFEESFESRCERIRTFYRQLWITSDCSKLSVVDGDAVQRYRIAIGEVEQVWGDGTEAPLEFGMVTAWPQIIGALLDSDVSGDLFSLVHLSNSCTVPSPGLPTLVAGTRVHCSASVVCSRDDAVAGRVVSVQAEIVNADTQTLMQTIVSDFAIRSFFGPLTSPIERETKQRYLLKLASSPFLKDVLLSKTWHNLDSSLVHDRIHADDDLVFAITSSETSAFGSIFHHGQHIGDVSGPGPQIRDFLSRHAIHEDIEHSFEQEQPLREITFSVPHDATSFALASRDANPIHTSVFAASLANLSSPIVHGMNTAARSRHALERAVHARVSHIAVRFESPLTGSGVLQLTASPTLVAMKDGRRVVDLVVRHDGAVVLRGRAELEDVNSQVYVFTGQGSASPMIGQELAANSVVAATIWKRADAFFKKEYGFSILQIVRENPRELRVQLTETQRASYAALSVNSDGVEKLLFPEALDPNVLEIVFKGGREGLLYATQFQQPAILLAEKAQYEYLRTQGVVSRRAFMAGHSLGEYSALTCLLRDLDVEKLAELVFLRGITMQSAVPRDHLGRSNYGMVATSPRRVGAWFSDEDMVALVDGISQCTKSLLQIVNFNVRRDQLVVSGELRALEILRVVLDRLRDGKQRDINAVMMAAIDSVASGRIEMKRGRASIPLRGIDVPFHSRLLLGGVASFRRVLSHAFSALEIDPDALDDKYVPNVLGVPFNSVEPAFAKCILEQTGSEQIKALLPNWHLTPRPQRARTLLIELLAFQFASPVLWTATMDTVLRQGVERFVEIGPAPVLLPFISKSYPSRLADLELLWAGSNEDQRAIFHLDDVVAPIVVDADVPEASAVVSPVVTQATSAPVPSAMVSQSTGASSQPLLIPLSVLHTIRVLAAHRLGLAFESVSPSKSLKTLSGGKSALQNELLGDLAAEFSVEPENGADLELTALADVVSQALPAPYLRLGKTMSALVSRVLPRSLPGGFSVSKVRSHIIDQFSSDDATVDGVLAHALMSCSESRFESIVDARRWIDGVVAAYASVRDVAIVYDAAPAASGAVVNAVIDKAALEGITTLLENQYDAFRAFFAENGRVEGPRDVVAEELGALAVAEVGERFLDGVRPIFKAPLVRQFDSSWNWARTDVIELLSSADDVTDQTLERVANKATPAVLAMLDSDGFQRRYELSASAMQLLGRLREACVDRIATPPLYRELRLPQRPQTRVSKSGEVIVSGESRYENGLAGLVDDAVVRCKDADADAVFQNALTSANLNGVSFAGRIAVVTGCGKGSIGLELVRCLLAGGAHVVLSTSRPTRARYELYRGVYRKWAAKTARLSVVPFNAASVQDVNAFVDYVVDSVGVPDFIVPFAALPQNGRDIALLDAQAELALRAMLTNVLRMLGRFKERLSTKTSSAPALVLLPLSPNHGTFGHDGLYAESKIGLETLFGKWASEGWSEQLSLVGAEIGWTRGTGLMNANDAVADAVELELGVRTFDAFEMAFCLAALLSAPVREQALLRPLRADLTGGFHKLSGDLPMQLLRERLMQEAAVAAAVHRDAELDSGDAKTEAASTPIIGRPVFSSGFPTLPQREFVEQHLPHLEGLIDLSRVVVVAGFGEVGPWGSSRTRWERELSAGPMSATATLELARSLNLVRYESKHAAFVDVKSGEVVHGADLWKRYGKFIESHCGIREIEPASMMGYEPNRKLFLQQVALEADMPPFEVSSEAEAEFLLKEHGERLEIEQDASGRVMARLRRGAVIYVPKRGVSDRGVAGQLPSSWNFSNLYGVDAQLASQIDPVTHYGLAATMEAFASAGIDDAYELYQYIHVSELGNTVGGGMGGMKAFKDVFQRRLLESPTVSSDVLQESFINSSAAWINMLLLSSCGAIRTPVAACATAAVSVELGVDAIRSGKARVVVAGGVEDLCEEGSFEFGQMKATSSSVVEKASGREPDEMCRPSASSRGGFMESQGAGVQLLMAADVALAMGVPIYAIIAGAFTATDRQGRSVPAPGKGIMSTAREMASSSPSPMLDLRFRRAEFEVELRALDEWKARREGSVDASFLQREFERRHRELQRSFGVDFYKHDASISPLRGCLAVWGLSPDDVTVCSFHGTGTTANDLNESSVVDAQMKALGRDPAAPLYVVCQKNLTGHPKGAAAGWMTNGLVQTLIHQVVPGNRNADNVDAKLAPYDSLVFFDKSIGLPRPALAAYLHSFGFGQASAEVVCVHADLLFAVVNADTQASYALRRRVREQRATQHLSDAMCGKRPFMLTKDHAPYEDSRAEETYLDPSWRLPGAASLEPQQKFLKASSPAETIRSSLRTAPSPSSVGVGVDLEEIAPFAKKDDVFRHRNFTAAELAYVASSASPDSSLTGRWCAKEAVLKALSSLSSQKNHGAPVLGSAGDALKDVEILSDAGVPTVVLHGRARDLADRVGVENVVVSISHCDDYAVAQAFAVLGQ